MPWIESIFAITPTPKFAPEPLSEPGALRPALGQPGRRPVIFVSERSPAAAADHFPIAGNRRENF